MNYFPGRKAQFKNTACQIYHGDSIESDYLEKNFSMFVSGRPFWYG